MQSVTRQGRNLEIVDGKEVDGQCHFIVPLAQHSTTQVHKGFLRRTCNGNLNTTIHLLLLGDIDCHHKEWKKKKSSRERGWISSDGLWTRVYRSLSAPQWLLLCFRTVTSTHLPYWTCPKEELDVLGFSRPRRNLFCWTSFSSNSKKWWRFFTVFNVFQRGQEERQRKQKERLEALLQRQDNLIRSREAETQKWSDKPIPDDPPAPYTWDESIAKRTAEGTWNIRQHRIT